MTPPRTELLQRSGTSFAGRRSRTRQLADARELEGGYQELARIAHPHPTISEAIPEAARAVDGWAIHQ